MRERDQGYLEGMRDAIAHLTAYADKCKSWRIQVAIRNQIEELAKMQHARRTRAAGKDE